MFDVTSLYTVQVAAATAVHRLTEALSEIGQEPSPFEIALVNGELTEKQFLSKQAVRLRKTYGNEAKVMMHARRSALWRYQYAALLEEHRRHCEGYSDDMQEAYEDGFRDGKSQSGPKAARSTKPVRPARRARPAGYYH